MKYARYVWYKNFFPFLTTDFSLSWDFWTTDLPTMQKNRTCSDNSYNFIDAPSAEKRISEAVASATKGWSLEWKRATHS